MVKAGLKAIYLSGWQVAADANLAGQTYPDQSLYPANSAPALVKRINNALLRADQIAHAEGDDSTHWLAPIVADAEAGFGGPLNAFELMKAIIEAGAAGVHFEDQLVVREEVRPPRRQGARADEPVRPHARRGPPRGRRARRADARRRPHGRALARRSSRATSTSATRVLHRRADARGLLPRPRRPRGAIARGLAYAPYADLHLVRDLDARPRRGRAVRRRDPRAVPGQAARLQLLAVVQLARAPDRRADRHASSSELGAMGYRFQFITLAGFHALNLVDVRARPRLPRRRR